MKLTIFILAIILLSTSQAQDVWSPVPSSEVSTSPEIQRLLNFGVNYITEQAVKDLKVPDTPYEVVQIIDVSRQVGNEVSKYNFSLELDNFEGTEILTNFTVEYEPSNDTARVTSFTYTYTITETACENDDPTQADAIFEEVLADLAEEEAFFEEELTLLPLWFDVDLDDLTTNQVIQDLLEFGAQRVLQGVIEEGAAPNTPFTVVDVYRIRVQVTSGIKYKFYAKLDNGQGTTIKIIFVVYYQAWTGRRDVTCYKYSALTDETAVPESEEEAIPNEEEPIPDEEEPAVVVDVVVEEPAVVVEVAVEEPAVEEEPAVVVDVVAEEPAVEEESAVVVEVAVEEPAVVEEEPAVVEEEPAVVEEVQEETIVDIAPSVIGGWSPVDSSEVENSNVIQDLLNFGADEVIRKAIEANKIPDSAYEIVQIYSVLRQVVNGLRYKFEVKLDNSEGTTVNATYVVRFEESTNTRSVTSSSYNSLTTELDCDGLDPDKTDYPTEDEGSQNEELTITNEYSVVDLSNVIGNEEVQRLIDLGVDAVIKGGRKDRKIPNSDFQVTEIYRVWRRSLDGVKYKFHVKLEDGNGVTVNAIFVVYSQDWSEKTKVTCFRYSVTET